MESRAPVRHGKQTPVTTITGHTFLGGLPTAETVQKAYDEADFSRAVEAYRFFYPTVSGAAILKGNLEIGVVPNRTFGMIDTKPRHVIFTANSDTPYGFAILDLSIGPIVVELIAGPLMVCGIDVNQRWVADMGLPGPDAGNGGRHLLLPPGFRGPAPDGYYAWRSTTNRLILGVRSLPVNGDVRGALARITTVRVQPLDPPADWRQPTWEDLTAKPQDTTPVRWETTLDYWTALHEVIDAEPPFEPYRGAYGDLAELGIEKGRPFAPDARLRGILERAAQVGNAQLRVASFADRRPERLVWSDRQWEWAALRFENGDFDAPGYADLHARDKWFFQAVGASPAMFRRSKGAGSLYWLGLRDRGGAYLDGGRTYRLSVPQPVPGKLFWSVTVYDAETRSQIQTEQGNAALRSMFELKEEPLGQPVDLYFGPTEPDGAGRRWIKTTAGRGWFVYFRIYGPDDTAFDGSWKPGDFEPVD